MPYFFLFSWNSPIGVKLRWRVEFNCLLLLGTSWNFPQSSVAWCINKPLRKLALQGDWYVHLKKKSDAVMHLSLTECIKDSSWTWTRENCPSHSSGRNHRKMGSNGWDSGWFSLSVESLEVTHLNRGANLFGVKVRSLTWLSVLLNQHVWTVGDRSQATYKEGGQGKKWDWGKVQVAVHVAKRV